jgi:uncharacterized protein YqeY
MVAVASQHRRRNRGDIVSTLKETLQSDLQEATKSRETLRMGTLRMVLAAITTEEVSGKVAKQLTDADVITVLNREAKKRKEAALAYDEASRPELAATERDELEIINSYLPPALDESELAQIIADAVAQAASQGQTGPAAMGAVMKVVTPAVSGRADGAAVAAAVKTALAN